ncbi:AMP-binding protein [Thermobifida halotolerans]|uniref:AMP-binding protein n=1 Tax=Thermobifida halotolerans TaxID=483545 RepID=UPI0035192DE4
MWGALSTGARLVVVPRWTARNPEECARFVRDQRITVLNQTPTAFGALAAAVLHGDIALPHLRYIIFCGEKLTPAALRPWADRFGLERPILVNMYGITETTVLTTFHEVTEKDLAGEASPIGRLLPGFTARVVTEDGRDAGPGEEGELWLAGPQVVEGYLNLPDLTAERFPLLTSPEGATVRYYRSGDLVSTAPDGGLVYHGRADLQVKLRGHRIELSDVEAAVRSHDAVADAVVWVHEFKPGDQRLVCAYVATEGAAPDARALRAHVRTLLPSYMHPAGYQRLPTPHLPRTINGKVDRAEVARIWEEERSRNR